MTSELSPAQLAAFERTLRSCVHMLGAGPPTPDRAGAVWSTNAINIRLTDTSSAHCRARRPATTRRSGPAPGARRRRPAPSRCR